MAEHQSNSPKHVPRRVSEFVVGDEKRTLFSADTANELVRPINRINNIIVGPGLQVKYSDSNVAIWLKGTEEPKGSIQPPGFNPSGSQGSTGSMVWRGEWNPATDYHVGDIVIISDETSILEGDRASTF